MVVDSKSQSEVDPGSKLTQPLKVYYSPHVEKLGDLRSLTLGVSGGTGESGNALTHCNIGDPFCPV